MTLRTVTYDDETHKVVPLEPNGVMKDVGAHNLPLENSANTWSAATCYRAMIAAAPEFKPRTVTKADIDQCNKDF